MIHATFLALAVLASDVQPEPSAKPVPGWETVSKQELYLAAERFRSQARMARAERDAYARRALELEGILSETRADLADAVDLAREAEARAGTPGWQVVVIAAGMLTLGVALGWAVTGAGAAFPPR